MLNSNPSNKDALAESINDLLSVLDNRSQDIIRRRYGLSTGQVETLDSIGKEYGITRERVRQIEEQAKKYMGKMHDVLDAIANLLNVIFEQNGGIIAEEHLLELVKNQTGTSAQPSLIIFYLDLMPLYQHNKGNQMFGPHWNHLNVHNQYTDQVILAAKEILEKSKQPLKEDELIQKIRDEIKVTNEILADSCIYALLVASQELQKTVFGEWGVANWVETSPRGVGDKAFIVLRRHGHPMHFRDITNQINEVKFDHKKAHEQTVHNELIKDGRFVLVGRGMYALKDWGFTPGTVADVLASVLDKSNQPLSKDEIIKRVLDQRLVKKTTVLLGLQNKQRFQKYPDDRYALKPNK